jgi:hypothetical protein
MTVVEMADRFSQALAADAALANWCRAVYGRGPAVRLGVDPGDQPRRVSECPFIVLLPDREQRDLPAGEQRMQLRAVLGVDDDGLQAVQNVQQLRGLVRLSGGMWPAVWRVLADALDNGAGNPEARDVSVYYEVAEFPLLMLVADITIQRRLPVGGRRG